MNQKQLLKMKSKGSFLIYAISVIVFCVAYILLGLTYYKFIPLLFLLVLIIPCFYRYIRQLVIFKDKLVKESMIESKILKGSYIVTGFKIFEASKNKEVEEVREKVLNAIYYLILCFVILLVLSISTIYC